jgi:hypothetical protein
MQFAGGMPIARVAEEWEREPEWVEQAVRAALLKSIPKRDGGLKTPRAEGRAERAEELDAACEAQGELGFES